MFFVRLGFILALVISFMPANSQNGKDAWAIATSAVSNRTHFCKRNPDVCQFSSKAWGAFKDKAYYALTFAGSKISQVATTPPSPETNITKRSARQPQSVVKREDSPSQNTLTKDDLKPKWRLSKLNQ